MKKKQITSQQLENIIRRILTEGGFFKRSLKEQEDLDDYEVPFTGEEFVEYINSEWDPEMLDMIIDLASERKGFIENMIQAATRTEVKGFGRRNAPPEED